MQHACWKFVIPGAHASTKILKIFSLWGTRSVFTLWAYPIGYNVIAARRITTFKGHLPPLPLSFISRYFMCKRVTLEKTRVLVRELRLSCVIVKEIPEGFRTSGASRLNKNRISSNLSKSCQPTAVNKLRASTDLRHFEQSAFPLKIETFCQFFKAIFHSFRWLNLH